MSGAIFISDDLVSIVTSHVTSLSSPVLLTERSSARVTKFHRKGNNCKCTAFLCLSLSGVGIPIGATYKLALGIQKIAEEGRNEFTPFLREKIPFLHLSVWLSRFILTFKITHFQPGNTNNFWEIVYWQRIKYCFLHCLTSSIYSIGTDIGSSLFTCVMLLYMKVPFLVPPKTRKMGHFGCFWLFWGYLEYVQITGKKWIWKYTFSQK